MKEPIQLQLPENVADLVHNDDTKFVFWNEKNVLQIHDFTKPDGWYEAGNFTDYSDVSITHLPEGPAVLTLINASNQMVNFKVGDGIMKLNGAFFKVKKEQVDEWGLNLSGM